MEDMSDYLSTGGPGTPVGAEGVIGEEFVFEPEAFEEGLNGIPFESESDEKETSESPKLVDNVAETATYTSPGGKTYPRQVNDKQAMR